MIFGSPDSCSSGDRSKRLGCKNLPQTIFLHRVTGNHAFPGCPWMWLLDSAALIRGRTARMERTSRWWIDGIGHFARHRLAFTARQTEVRDRIQQHPRVWMLRLAEEYALGCHLTKAAKIHDPDMIGDVVDNGKVVADEQIGQAEPTLELFDQVENLRLDRNVKCRGWLVANEKIRVAGDRSRDRNTLTLATAELVGIFLAVARGETHLQEQLCDAVAKRCTALR